MSWLVLCRISRLQTTPAHGVLREHFGDGWVRDGRVGGGGGTGGWVKAPQDEEVAGLGPKPVHPTACARHTPPLPAGPLTAGPVSATYTEQCACLSRLQAPAPPSAGPGPEPGCQEMPAEPARSDGASKGQGSQNVSVPAFMVPTRSKLAGLKPALPGQSGWGRCRLGLAGMKVLPQQGLRPGHAKKGPTGLLLLQPSRDSTALPAVPEAPWAG